MPTWQDASIEQRIKVLQRLANDPGYRQKMQANPVDAFADEGISLGPNEVPKGPFTLLSSQEILDKLDYLAGNPDLCECHGSDFWRG